jgi:hypothetical protein
MVNERFHVGVPQSAIEVAMQSRESAHPMMHAIDGNLSGLFLVSYRALTTIFLISYLTN